MNRYLRFISLMLVSLFSFSSLADENTKQIGEYTIHYNVFNSTFLQPETANQYGLKRSKSVALVNITVKDTANNKAITAQISGKAYNLAGQQKDLAFKEVKETDAVYYFANLRFADQEQLSFRLTIKPDGVDKELSLEFDKKLYMDK
ncbi:DUF4426 domain-containing protein [Pleionea sediminis]|uniref:DUF4426 domain-containing protein n=1 Tax=Pleionea sediminis TaxID=2569479 RepID=UPI0013DE1FC3|nr:DUF4426 domain-containing protein [Pleionea sediminis]